MTALPILHLTTLTAALALLAWAALSDVRRFRIPNGVSIGLVALYPAHVLLSPVGVDWLMALAIAGGTLVGGFGLYVLRAWGAGDAKMFAALALWAGLPLLPEYLILTALSGGVMALAALTPVRITLAQMAERAGLQQGRDALLAGNLPYGLAIAIGGVFILTRLATA